MIQKEIVREIEKEPNSRIRFAITDIDGVLRGKTISAAKFIKSMNKNIGFCNVIFGWDLDDVVYENSDVTGWHTGYPDSLARIDLLSARKIPWSENEFLFLADFRQSDVLGDVCPRSLLHTVYNQAKEMGFLPKFSTEYEWYNFSETPDTIKEKRYDSPSPITPGMFGYSMIRPSSYPNYYSQLFCQLREFGVPIESLHTETGDGVYEAGIEYDDVMVAADRSVLFKQGVKEIASKHNIMPSFMAKWDVDLPGSGGHIHQSLWNHDGSKNLFHSMSGLNKTMQHYLAGQLACLPYILPMYAPTINSYKRFVEGSWASTTVSWGEDNRTTALRVIKGSKDAYRLELRVPGADANPYLVMAAALASGLYGIKNELLPRVQSTSGNEYQNESKIRLAGTLQEATEQMKQSDIPVKLFGEKFVNHFIKTREWECQQYNKAITNWELKRYFEII